MDPMKTALIDSNACAPKDGGVDEEAQTHETPRGEKTREVWGPCATFSAFAFAFVLLLTVGFVVGDFFLYRVTNTKVLESVRADVRDMKETLYARARDPEFYVVSDVYDTTATDADTAYAQDLAMRYHERGADAVDEGVADYYQH